MSLKQRATVVENTGGQLKYLQGDLYIVDQNGLEVDFTDTEIFEFEDNRLKCSHLEIFNLGPDKCMVGFDRAADSMIWTDRKSFNHPIYPGEPFNYLSLDGEADSLSLRTLAGTTATIEIIVW